MQQQVLSRAVLDAVPTGRSVPTLGAMLPGARLALPDVGGTSGMQNRDLTVHGSDGRDTTFMIDGMTVNGIEGDGSVQSYFNDMMFEEVSYQTSAINAETSAGGVRANMIPKDGGNQFKGSAFFSGGNRVLQSRQHRATPSRQGLRAPDALNKVWDVNVAEGGPIKKDKLWFFASCRDWGVLAVHRQQLLPLTGQRRAADHRRCAHLERAWPPDDARRRQAQDRRRISTASASSAATRTRPAPAMPSPARPPTSARPSRYYTGEIKYTGTLSSKLLVEAGFAINNESYALTPLDPSSVPQLEQGGQTPTDALSFPSATSRCDGLRPVRRRHLLSRADPQDLRWRRRRT